MSNPENPYDFRNSSIPPIVEDFQSSKPLTWPRVERRSQLSPRCQEDIADGIITGARAILADRELLKGFWKAGFEEFVTHGQQKGAQWIGSKILSWLATTLLMGAVAVASYMYARK